MEMCKIKTIVNKRQSDLAWIQDFLALELVGRDRVVVNASEKQFNNIYCKYGQFVNLKYNNYDNINLYYYDSLYAYRALKKLNGKYGTFYTIEIIDTQKQSKHIYDEKLTKQIKRLYNRVKKGRLKEENLGQLVELSKQQFELEKVVEYSPFGDLRFEDEYYNDLQELEDKLELIYDKIEEY